MVLLLRVKCFCPSALIVGGVNVLVWSMLVVSPPVSLVPASSFFAVLFCYNIGDLYSIALKNIGLSPCPQPSNNLQEAYCLPFESEVDATYMQPKPAFCV